MRDILRLSADGAVLYEHLTSSPVCFSFHLHERCEIYFPLSGGINYFVEKRIYPLGYGDLVVTNPFEIHKPAPQSGQTYERIVLQFDPARFRVHDTPQLDLLSCFYGRRRGEGNRVALDPVQLSGLWFHCRRFEALPDEPDAVRDLLMNCYMTELIVFLNRLYGGRSGDSGQSNMHPLLVRVLQYIDAHLDGELTLSRLEQEFFISKSHLSKLFKRYTGQNLHEYIIYKRISLAKRLLSEGLGVTETCGRCGFNDYSNFIRAFRRTVGIPPGRYRSQK